MDIANTRLRAHGWAVCLERKNHMLDVRVSDADCAGRKIVLTTRNSPACLQTIAISRSIWTN